MILGICGPSAATGSQYTSAEPKVSITKAFQVSLIGLIGLIGLIRSSCPLAAQEVPANNMDATPVVENLGIPSAPYYQPRLGNHYNNYEVYPRNPWSLFAFDGRIYIGNGNSANSPPSANAGPAPVLSYNPATNAVTKEYMTADEQIDVFRVINGELVIPGHDPLADWTLGNFYRLRGGTWSLTRTIPGAIHTFDMIGFGGALYAAVGNDNGGAVDRSLDDGATWTSYQVYDSDRAYALLAFQGNLFASADSLTFPNGVFLRKWTAPGFSLLPFSSVPGRVHYPQTIGKVLRNLVFDQKLIYIMAEQYNDIQSRPYGLYTAATMDAPAAVPLGTGEIPYDITVSGDQLFLLTGTPNKTGGYLVKVRATSDTINWPVVFYFTATTLPRSFAMLNDDFYIGLGSDPATFSDTTILSPDTGRLLRVKGVAINAVSPGPVTINEPTMPALLPSNHIAVHIEDVIQFNQATTGQTTLSWSIADGAGVSYLASHVYIPAMPAGGVYKLVLDQTLRTGPFGDPLKLLIRLTDREDQIAIDSHSKATMAVGY